MTTITLENERIKIKRGCICGGTTFKTFGTVSKNVFGVSIELQNTP